MMTRISRNNYGKLEYRHKRDNVISFSRFCDLDLDFLRVIKDLMSYSLKAVSYTTYFKLEKKYLKQFRTKPGGK